MKALVKYQEGPRNIEVREVEVPSIDDHEVLVRTRAAGFCGTDLEIYRWDFKTTIPVIMGHEGAGEVAAAGSSVTGVKVGDRVALETSKIICGACHYCRTGRYNLCPGRRGMGYGTDGTFAEYVKVNGSRVHRIPENISFEEAGILETLSVATRAGVQIAAVKGGDTVLVSGPGPIGLLLVQVARAAGASKIIMVGRKSQNRLRLARELGAAHVFSAQEDMISAVKDITNGKGADLFFECSGNADAFVSLIPTVKKGGQIILVGLYPKEVQFGLNAIVTNELEVKGTWTSGVFTDWARTIFLAPMVLLRPAAALLRLIRPPEDSLRKWDELLRRRPTLGFYSADAHIFYSSILGLFRVHVLLDGPLSASNMAARQEIFLALEKGRFFCAIDGAAAARGFRAERSGSLLRVRTPFDFAHETVFLRNGRVIRQTDGPSAEIALDSPGVYRVEVYLRARTPLDPAVPWIISNAFEVKK